MDSLSLNEVNSSTQPAAKPVMQRFLELAVLLNMINPGRILDATHEAYTQIGRKESDIWHRFLNEFAYLGDICRGGLSVTSTVGVVISDQPTLLVASNNAMRPETFAHLQLVLKRLQNTAGSDREHQTNTTREILESSLYMSREKVQNYCKTLGKLVSKALEFLASTVGGNSSPLRDKLGSFQDVAKAHFAICKEAYDFSKSEGYEFLKQACSEYPDKPVFKQVRHYIGRLGSWHRATLVLVNTAVQTPDLVQGLTLRKVPAKALACRVQQVNEGALCELIQELQLDLKTDFVLQNVQSLYTKAHRKHHKENPNINTAFVERFSGNRFKPIVHPEILLAEHVFRGKLKFIRGDPYIGCSKPSCISCYLYLQKHPLKITPRACHGNLWPKWCPPVSSQNSSEHNDALIEDMIQELRTVLKARLLDRQTITARLPDSVTNISG